MEKLNTHSIYLLATVVHPLETIEHKEGMKLKDAYWVLLSAQIQLAWFIGTNSFFSPSLKRAAVAALNSITDAGMPTTMPWDPGGADALDSQKELNSYNISLINAAITKFETVLANELPGLAIYHVDQKGIYSTDDLLTKADCHIPETVRKELPGKAAQDIREAGKCLAFDLSTASAFHTWRALETVMGYYYVSLTGKTFEESGVKQNWGAYITALKTIKAEEKITSFLDHIRGAYRNPISHPEETLESEEAFSLFSAGISAITQAMRAAIGARDGQSQG